MVKHNFHIWLQSLILGAASDLKKGSYDTLRQFCFSFFEPQDTQRELLAKQQKVEQLERRLKTFKDESKCLKLIQAQLKESLSEAKDRICLLNNEVDQKVQALSKKEQELSSLREGMKKVKWELTEALQEKEAALSDSRRLLERALVEMNAAWESKIKSSSAWGPQLPDHVPPCLEWKLVAQAQNNRTTTSVGSRPAAPVALSARTAELQTKRSVWFSASPVDLVPSDTRRQ